MAKPTILDGDTNYLGQSCRKEHDMTMRAAVVRSFDHPPRYETYDTPEPAGIGGKENYGAMRIRGERHSKQYDPDTLPGGKIESDPLGPFFQQRRVRF